MPRHLTGLLSGSPFFLAVLVVQAAQATPLQGIKQVALHAQDGSRVVIGELRFTPRADGGTGFIFKPDHTPFSDYFLSMREFKCLAGGSEILCHVPYPYRHPGTVSDNNLAWLEHSLLFMFKKPNEFGAKLWNGVYWQLRATPSGWEGRPQAVDLNLIGAPPARLDVPPFKPALRDDMAPGSRWFQRLTIE